MSVQMGKMLMPFQEKMARRLAHYKRRIKYVLPRPNREAMPVFVLGYGRSGTTMVLNTFALDERIEIFGENDPRIAHDFKLVFERVGFQISTCKAEVMVLKPILNSFDASIILKNYANSKVIWMLRDYYDVVASAIARFGLTVADYLKEKVLIGKGNNWLANGIPEETLTILRQVEKSCFTIYDWMALVWWSVNRTILIDRVYESERFMLLRYEHLVRSPELILTNLYGFMRLEYKRGIGKYIHETSVGKGSGVHLNRTVQEMCQALTTEIALACQISNRTEVV
jgi:hypothetical protein